jgi:hypothetical protein
MSVEPKSPVNVDGKGCDRKEVDHVSSPLGDKRVGVVRGLDKAGEGR